MNHIVMQTAKAVSLFVFLLCAAIPLSVAAQASVYVDASTLLPQASIFFSPRTATVLEGSTIEIPVFINTKGRSINTISLKVKFDPSKFIIVKPSSTNSIIGIWVEPPTYSNQTGSMQLSGVITNGITTDAGLITTITFRAVTTGIEKISVSDITRVLANDGQGTEVKTELDRGTYTIIPRPAEGPVVFSNTHPFQDAWYNNQNPVISWDKADGVTDFSFAFDNKPFTIPDDTPDTSDTVTSYQNTADGIWYFHIKARKQGIWGGTTHFIVRIDTTPPAAFDPLSEIVTSNGSTRALISFFTTDTLAGLDHYEVGIVAKEKSAADSPAFVQSDSPYQLSLPKTGGYRVTVRAFDRAGNVRDETIDVGAPLSLYLFLENNWIIILLVLLIILHYFFGHKIIPHVKRILKVAKEEESEENIERLEELARERTEPRPFPAPQPTPPVIPQGANAVSLVPKRDTIDEIQKPL